MISTRPFAYGSARDRYYEYSPHCYGLVDARVGWSPDRYYDDLSLHVTSAGRGFFGVGHDAQEMGHGDRIFLDFILTRHRARNVIEFGTAGGVTSLYFGMAMLLRDGDVHTFDYVDARSGAVKGAWLQNMFFHLGDASEVTPFIAGSSRPEPPAR